MRTCVMCSTLVRIVFLSTATLAVLVFHNLTIARPDLSRLSFHPVPLEHVVEASRAADQPRQIAVAIPIPVLRSSRDETRKYQQASIESYRRAIAKAQAEQGPYASSIGEQTLALGKLLHGTGDEEGALAAFERSMHVLRVNLGLFSIEQVPVMKAIINTHLALGDVASAHTMQEALLNLQRKQHPDTQVALVPALLEWADWNVSLYLLQGGRHTALTLGMPSQLSSALHDPRLSLAYATYSEALAILERDSDGQDARLVTTERKLAALNFMINRELEDSYGAIAGVVELDPDFNSPGMALQQANAELFMAGSSALQRAIAHSSKVPNPDYDDVAARMMELGDWYLLFDRRAAALEMYGDALEVMQAASLPQEDVERIMTPGMPVPTPDATYLPATVDRSHYAGYIDVQFELSRFGMATNPRIIASSGVERQIEKELLRTIRDCKFRPKFVAGSAVNEQNIQLRYYYSL